MRLGIGSYTFTWAIGVPGHVPDKPMSPMDLLREAQRLSVKVVQFCDNLPLLRLESTELQQVEKIARDGGLEIEVGTRGLDLDNLRANLELARRLGSPFLRLVIDAPDDEPTPDEVIERLQPLLPEFVTAGVRLAIENHDRFTCSTLLKIINTLGTEQVGICLDTVNSFGALEAPKTVVESLVGCTLNLHVKDFVIQRIPSQMGFQVTGCPAGQGRLDIPWVLHTLSIARRKVNAIVELWTPFGPTLEETISRERTWVDESITYLRKWIQN